jgi:hypothetical protein
MVINLPDRQDLETTSCMNQEMKLFNRKLHKHMKFFDYAFSLKVMFEKGSLYQSSLLFKNERKRSFILSFHILKSLYMI